MGTSAWLAASFVKVYADRSVVAAVNSAFKEAHGEALKSIHPEAKLTAAVGKALMHTVNRVLQVMIERGMGHPAMTSSEVVDAEDLVNYA